MKLVANTATRAESNTSGTVNDRIRRETQRRVVELAGRPAAIHARLRELGREWDIERCLETGSSALTLTGLALAATVHKRWLILPALVQGFFMQHAIQGWCPPLPLFRRMGVRTQREIEAERHALKALLGYYKEAGEAANGDGREVARRVLGAAIA